MDYTCTEREILPTPCVAPAFEKQAFKNNINSPLLLYSHIVPAQTPAPSPGVNVTLLHEAINTFKVHQHEHSPKRHSAVFTGSVIGSVEEE